MPMQIHVAWENVDTIVELASPRRRIDRYFKTPDGQNVRHLRVLNSDHTRRYELLKQDRDLFHNLITRDPDIDIESAGEPINKTYRIYVDKGLQPAFSFTAYDVMTRPSGEIEERFHAPPQPNVNETIPLKISAPRYTPLEVATQFVISKSFYLLHSDGVSYRFLYEIAQSLDSAKKFAAITAYHPITLNKVPIVLFRSNPPFPAAFLEGHVKKDAYCLILHLSRQELKVPMNLQEEEEIGSKAIEDDYETAKGGNGA